MTSTRALAICQSFCKYSSHESVFAGPTPEFWDAAHGKTLSDRYVAQDISVPAAGRELNNE